MAFVIVDFEGSRSIGAYFGVDMTEKGSQGWK